MSFSSEVKDEISRQISEARHCGIAELAAILEVCGTVQLDDENHCTLKVQTENGAVARKCFTLVKKTFNIKMNILTDKNAKKRSVIYTLLIADSGDALRVLQATKLVNEWGQPREDAKLVGGLVVQQPCCRRAFIRGVFLACGSMSDPKKSYHLEFVFDSKEKAEQLEELIRGFGIVAKWIQRKKYYVVYLKESEQIVDMLNIMEAHDALMELENIRILKDMRNNVNRKVNCETANINKTVDASQKQINDIIYIRDTVGLEDLAEKLQEIAELRMENPDLSLVELGGLLQEPVGKSGVNHRLRKITEIAEQLREKGRNQDV